MCWRQETLSIGGVGKPTMVTANMLGAQAHAVVWISGFHDFSPRPLPYFRVPYTREPQLNRQAIQKGCPTRRTCFAIGSHSSIVAKTSWFSPTGRGAGPQTAPSTYSLGTSETARNLRCRVRFAMHSRDRCRHRDPLLPSPDNIRAIPERTSRRDGLDPELVRAGSPCGVAIGRQVMGGDQPGVDPAH